MVDFVVFVVSVLTALVIGWIVRPLILDDDSPLQAEEGCDLVAECEYCPLRVEALYRRVKGER